MKKVACLALVGALGLFGCGGGGSDDDDDIIFYDASDNPGDPDANTGACNPVSQTGCENGQKCTFIQDLESGAGHVGCTADGDKNLGEACTEPTELGVADDCMAGGYCYNDTCRKVCDELIAGSCNGEDKCNNFVDADLNPLPIDWCLFACDPLAQDCTTENEACYLDFAGGGDCLRHSDIPAGEACVFTNDCAEGTQCLGGFCRTFCGDWTLGFNVDAMDQLTWPNCCSSECTELTTPCTGVNELCMFVWDGTNIVHDSVGYCVQDADAPYIDQIVCDCTAHAAGEDQCVDTMPARSSLSERPGPMPATEACSALQ